MPKCSKCLPVLILLALSAGAFSQYDPNQFDPDNAAHWYRKAFALYEEPNDIDLDAYIDEEIELIPAIADFLKSQKPVIDLVTKAAQIEHCDWEFDPLANGTYAPPPYLGDTKKIARLFIANAHSKEETGMQLDMIKNYETILLFASHIDGEQLIDHLVALGLRGMTYNAIHRYVNRHSNLRLRYLYNVDMLLNKSYNKTTLKDTLNEEIEYSSRILTNYKIYKDTYLCQAGGIPFTKLSADFYKRNLIYYKEYMITRQSYLGLPYPQAVQKFFEQRNTLKQEFRTYFGGYQQVLNKNLDSLWFNNSFLADVDIDDIEGCDFLYTIMSTSSFVNMLSIETQSQTKLNALKTAINLLIKFRRIKSIPERLPTESPKDLFSDKPFLIVKTDDGFKLKCQGEDLSRNEVYEYEFKLPKE